MANSSDTRMKKITFYETIKHFPPVINSKINVMEFLEASADILLIIDRLGKVFTPAKYDMQGNIEKIKRYYQYDKNSCLLELILNDKGSEKPGIESVVWLNRALLFLELLFQEMSICVQNNDLEISSKKMFTMAYEGSLKRYHNWVTQQIFALMCKMAPTVSQILKNFDGDEDIKAFQTCFNTYHIKLHIIRSKIDDFIKENNLFND